MSASWRPSIVVIAGIPGMIDLFIIIIRFHFFTLPTDAVNYRLLVNYFLSIFFFLFYKRVRLCVSQFFFCTQTFINSIIFFFLLFAKNVFRSVFVRVFGKGVVGGGWRGEENIQGMVRRRKPSLFTKCATRSTNLRAAGCEGWDITRPSSRSLARGYRTTDLFAVFCENYFEKS